MGGVVVIGHAQCAPREKRVALDCPTCIWIGSTQPAVGSRSAELDDTELLSFREALEVLRVSRNTLYKLVGADKIPGARRVGRAWRFHRASLVDWLSCTGPGTHGRQRKP